MTLLDILAPLPQFRSLKKAQDFLDELCGRGYSLSITITDKPPMDAAAAYYNSRVNNIPLPPQEKLFPAAPTIMASCPYCKKPKTESTVWFEPIDNIGSIFCGYKCSCGYLYHHITPSGPEVPRYKWRIHHKEMATKLNTLSDKKW